MGLEQACRLIGENLRRPVEPPLAVTVAFGDRLMTSAAENKEDRTVSMVLASAIKGAHRQRGLESIAFNPLIVVAKDLAQIPAWLYLHHPDVATVAVAKPDVQTREMYFRDYADSFYGSDEADPSDVDHVATRFANVTEGFYLSDLESLRITSHTAKIPVQDVAELVRFFRHGKQEDPWNRLSVERVLDARHELAERVYGQDHAIARTAEVLALARSGITLDAGEHSRPKGVFLFVGPTGVGKTELAKELTRFIFGDARLHKRFDMSEYSQEHAAEKLTGSPPGYVGYGEGGQLTNWVRERPYSLILMDEIDKAHPRVLDRLLQVLDEGRLTDGEGRTVEFDQTLIVFTSNWGGSICENSPLFSEIKSFYETAVRTRFQEINRMELLGRIGQENIVVFDVFREAVLPRVRDKFLANIRRSLRRQYDAELVMTPSALAHLDQRCLEPQNIQLGYRGVRNVVGQFASQLSTIVLERSQDPSWDRRVEIDEDALEV
jgi:ATP-dependent Clp protease ATP-binding subunit ClpA